MAHGQVYLSNIVNLGDSYSARIYSTSAQQYQNHDLIITSGLIIYEIVNPPEYEINNEILILKPTNIENGFPILLSGWAFVVSHTEKYKLSSVLRYTNMSESFDKYLVYLDNNFKMLDDLLPENLDLLKKISFDDITGNVLFNNATWPVSELPWSNLVNAPLSTIEEIDDSVTLSHTHDNKDVVDLLTQQDLDDIHTHFNQDILDDVTQEHLDNTHNHDNKDVLDNVLQEHLDNTHIHNNKIVLDNITQTQIDKIHEHDNFNLLANFSTVDCELYFDNRPVAKNTFSWNDLTGKPASSSVDIDDTVIKKHTHDNMAVVNNLRIEHLENIHLHTNKTVLDKLSAIDCCLYFHGLPVMTEVNWDDVLDKPVEINTLLSTGNNEDILIKKNSTLEWQTPNNKTYILHIEKVSNVWTIVKGLPATWFVQKGITDNLLIIRHNENKLVSNVSFIPINKTQVSQNVETKQAITSHLGILNFGLINIADTLNEIFDNTQYNAFQINLIDTVYDKYIISFTLIDKL